MDAGEETVGPYTPVESDGGKRDDAIRHDHGWNGESRLVGEFAQTDSAEEMPMNCNRGAETLREGDENGGQGEEGDHFQKCGGVAVVRLGHVRDWFGVGRQGFRHWI